MKFLTFIEKTGNKLPDPATLFVIGTALVFLFSLIIANLAWVVTDPKGNTITAFNLVSSDGAWWLLSTMVKNFINFPPLGIVLVGMLGIGLAEKTGFLPALLQFSITHVHQRLLTPATMLLGILSSIEWDAGYVVLVPLAAAIYIAAGRSLLTGIAVSFAGVSAGFSANFFIIALDPLLAGFTQSGAQIIDANYEVAVTGNWWFMIVSTVLLTFAGWFVTERFVEPAIEGVANQNLDSKHDALNHTEKRALYYSLASVFILLILAYATKVSSVYSRFIFLLWIVITPILLSLFRIAIRSLLHKIRGSFRNTRSVAIIGAGDQAM